MELSGGRAGGKGSDWANVEKLERKCEREREKERARECRGEGRDLPMAVLTYFTLNSPFHSIRWITIARKVASRLDVDVEIIMRT